MDAATMRLFCVMFDIVMYDRLRARLLSVAIHRPTGVLANDRMPTLAPDSIEPRSAWNAGDDLCRNLEPAILGALSSCSPGNATIPIALFHRNNSLRCSNEVGNLLGLFPNGMLNNSPSAVMTGLCHCQKKDDLCYP
jgi:hypothetical protein